MCLTAINRYAENSSARLPTRPVPLIRECIEALVNWQLHHKTPTNWPDTLTSSEVIRILAPLAFSTFKSDNGGLIPLQVVDDMPDTGRQKLIQHLIPGYFILRTDSGYLFPLDTFREFYAAYAIASTSDPFAAIRKNLHNPKWQQLILYTAGSMDRVVASRIDLTFPTFSYLVVYCVGPFSKALARIGAAAVDPTSKIAGAALTGVGDIAETVRGPLERWFANSRRSTEYFLTSILRRQSRFEGLLRRDWWLAVRCLAESPGCTDALAVQLVSLHPRNRKERSQIIRHLSIVVRHPQIQQILLKQTQDDPDPDAREASVEALSDVIVEPSVQVRLLDLLRQHRSPAAAAALKQGASDASVVEQLLELAERPDEHLEAIEVLGAAVSDERAQRRLLELTCRAESDVRIRATKALSGTASRGGVQQRLLELTRNADTDVAMTAVEALTPAASDIRVQERLLEITQGNLTHDDVWIHKAIAALGGIASIPPVRDRLIELSRNKYVFVAQAAVQALVGATADPEVTDHLLSLDHHPIVIGAAMRALARVAQDPRVRERFIELSKHQGDKYVRWSPFTPEDDQIFVRRPAVEGLTNLPPDPALCSHMLYLITDYERIIREMAARWLFWAAPHEPSIREPLLELTRVDNRFSYIRQAAVFALGAIASEATVRGRLLELTYDPDPVICGEAAGSLRKAASDPAVGERLLALTYGNGHPNRHAAVRITAARALEDLPKEAITKNVLKRVERLARRDAPVFDSLWTLVQTYEGPV
jgi:HEAT repeat protein